MRHITEAPPPLPSTGSRADQLQWHLNLTALTPIYKGGASSSGIDADRPFRASSIRGILRFWWRATSEESSVTALRQREDELFEGREPSVEKGTVDPGAQ